MNVPSTLQVAFKEWAAVCEALAAGRQTILLRKGGIHEGRAGFRVEHREFWLYPTNFHQAADGLTSEGAVYLARAQARQPPAGRVLIQHLAVIDEVVALEAEEEALSLGGLHIWSPATVRQRFAYRQPGMFLLVVRIFAAPQPAAVAETAAMAGCKSWVTLPEALSTADLRPVISDEVFREAKARIQTALRTDS